VHRRARRRRRRERRRLRGARRPLRRPGRRGGHVHRRLLLHGVPRPAGAPRRPPNARRGPPPRHAGRPAKLISHNVATDAEGAVSAVETYNYLGLDEETIRDPYPFYRLLQSDSPVYEEPE